MTTPYIRIVWNNATVGEWNALLRAVPRSTLTQTFAYAEAMLLTERWQPRLGIIEADDRPIGLVQALQKKAVGLALVTRVHRGPLWLDEAPDPVLVEGSLKALRQSHPSGITRWTTVLPELPSGPQSEAMLARCGFRRDKGEGYRTIWLDLRPDEDVLRRRLRGNWRNHLNAAERSALSVETDPEHRGLPWLLERYAEDKAARGYRGPSAPLVVRLRNALHKGGAKDHGVLLLRAMLGGQPVAGVLMLRHGQAATYQIGWNGPEGRRLNAHQLLVWRAMLELKRAGVAWLDLGGINPQNAAGVTGFKRGLGGDEVELAGSYV